MGKLSFAGAKTSNFKPKCNADKSYTELITELAQDAAANAEPLKKLSELKAKATEIMDAMSKAGNPHNVKYSVYKNKEGETQFKLTINGGGVALKDEAGKDVVDEKGNKKIVGGQTLDLILDSDMNVAKRFISTKEWDAANKKMITTPLKKNQYNQAIQNMLVDLKDYLPAAPAREMTDFVKNMLDQLREISPVMQVPEKVKEGDKWVPALDEDGHEKMKNVQQYYAKFDTYTDEKGKTYNNLIISNHGDEQLTVALNDEQTGIRGVRYTDFAKYKETNEKKDVVSVWLDDTNLDVVRDDFMHDDIIGGILLKDTPVLEVSNSFEADMNAPEIDDLTIDDDEIPFG